MELCRFFGSELNTIEFSKGYIGAINNPIKGNANAISGISASVLIFLTSSPTTFGSTK
jgi:hypothetical protein